MSVYLSRLILNPRHREVRRDLGDCHGLHQRILAAFPAQDGIDGHARQHFGVLYRVETHPRSDLIQLLVQSAHEPDWSSIPPTYLDDTRAEAANPACRTIDDAWAAIYDGMRLTFRLRANPTKRIDKRRDDPLAGKRVELQTEPEWLDWIARHATRGGFELLTVNATADTGVQESARRHAAEMFGFDVLPGEPVLDTRANPAAKVVGHKGAGKRKKPLTFGSVLFEGRLRVTDADIFRETLARGIGSGKAYGFGLLSIAPAR